MTVDKTESQNRLTKKVKKWGGNVTNILTDYASGNATVKILKNGQIYSFSHSAKNVTVALSVLSWSVCRLIDCDIRGILPFEKTAKAYLQIESSMKGDFVEADEKWYQALELTSQASNEEVMKKFKQFAKDFHPDTVQNQQLKADIEKRFSSYTEAYNEIKKARKF